VLARLDVLPSQVENARLAWIAYMRELEQKAPLWRRLLGNWKNEDLENQQKHYLALYYELQKLKEEHPALENRIENVKKTKKRYLEAQLSQNVATARRQVEAKQHEQFCSVSTSNLAYEFDRTKFYIQSHDYRRGNAIDNYFRRIEDIVLTAFEHRCVFCGSGHNLTFDHYGLPKNEGGNFALILADKSSISLNIVVLCRGCNSAKGQLSHQYYFNDAQRNRAMACQRTLLETLLAEGDFLKLIKKWHRK
jgi:hypothetical protein